MKQFGVRLTAACFLVAAVLAACGHRGSSTGVIPQTEQRQTWTGARPDVTQSPPPYCSGFTRLSSGVPVNVTDDSGFGPGVVLLLYITNGANFMSKSGTFTSSIPVPYPVACFPTAKAKIYSIKIPSGVGGGRIYLAYATPVPSQPSAVPNPFQGVNISGPNPGYAGSTFPWDKVEYATTSGATIDTTQVDDLGLPLEISVTQTPLPQLPPMPSPLPSTCATHPPTIAGVTPCSYAKIFETMEQTKYYSSLVLAQRFAGKLIDLQIVAPKDAVSFTAFPWNLFAESAYLPAPRPSVCPSTAPNGYLSCIVAAYKTPMTGGRLFRTNGIGANGVSGHNYCAYSDGTNFVFTDVGGATACATASPNPSAASPNPFKMPVNEFTYGVPPATSEGNPYCKLNILFQQPWGNADVGSGLVFKTADAFALWKGVTSDLMRGTMLDKTVAHPVGITSPKMSDFFKDPMYNQYAYIIHKFFNNNLAYAIAYDDLGNFESGVIWNSGNPINIRVDQIPLSSQVIPASPPVPTPAPGPCATLRPGVGSF